MNVKAMLKRARLILTADDTGKLVCLIQKQPGDVPGHFGIALADFRWPGHYEESAASIGWNTT